MCAEERAYFDQAAKAWDTPLRVQRAQAIAGRMAKEFRKTTPHKVLEFGCGTGLISQCMGDMFAEIHLMDTSEGMIDALSEKIKDAGIRNMHPVRFAIMEESYPDTFDGIYSSMVLHHIKDAEQAIGRLYDMLAPGGMLCLVDLDVDDGAFHANCPDFDGHDGFSHDQIRGMMASAGFGSITIDTFYHSEKPMQDKAVPYSLFCASGVKR